MVTSTEFGMGNNRDNDYQSWANRGLGFIDHFFGLAQTAICPTLMAIREEAPHFMNRPKLRYNVICVTFDPSYTLETSLTTKN